MIYKPKLLYSLLLTCVFLAETLAMFELLILNCMALKYLTKNMFQIGKGYSRKDREVLIDLGLLTLH
jgi:hypothetical protein